MKRSKLSIALGLAMIPMIATAASQSEQKFVDESDIMELLDSSFDDQVNTNTGNNFDATDAELSALSTVSELYNNEPQISENDSIRMPESVEVKPEVYLEATKPPVKTGEYVFDKPMTFETGIDAIEKNDTYRQKLSILELEAAMLEKQLEMVEMKASIKEVTDTMNRDEIRGEVRAEEQAVFAQKLAEKEAEHQEALDLMAAEIASRDETIAAREADILDRNNEIIRRGQMIVDNEAKIAEYIEKIKELENQLLYGTEEEPEDTWMLTEEMFALGSIRGKRNDLTALVYFEDYDLHVQAGDYILGDKNAQIVKVNTDNVIIRLYNDEYVLVPMGNAKAAQWAREHAVDDTPEEESAPAPAAGTASSPSFDPNTFDPLAMAGFNPNTGNQMVGQNPQPAFMTDPAFESDPMSNPAVNAALFNTQAPLLPNDPITNSPPPPFGPSGFATEIQ